MALWRGAGGGALCPQLAADALELVLAIAVEEGVAALVGELLLLTLRVPPL